MQGWTRSFQGAQEAVSIADLQLNASLCKCQTEDENERVRVMEHTTQYIKATARVYEMQIRDIVQMTRLEGPTRVMLVVVGTLLGADLGW